MSAQVGAKQTGGAGDEGPVQQTPGSLRRALLGPFDLSRSRTPEVQYFHMQTQFVHLGFDGKRTGIETYLLRLRCTPAELSGNSLDEYECREFGLQLGVGETTTLPSLQRFAYRFDYMAGVGGNGPMFGIPQGPFLGLRDSRGETLAPDICYAVYNNFVDFHALTDLFPRPLKFIKGIEQLRSIGDRIVHPGAFTEAPVSVTGVVRSGSIFRNGELTLELKGASLVDDRPCALVNYDSGESTLRMAFLEAGHEDVAMEGGSRYTGDLYIDLASGWVRKVILNESVVTQTSTASRPAKVPGYTLRHIQLRLIDRKDFEQPISILA